MSGSTLAERVTTRADLLSGFHQLAIGPMQRDEVLADLPPGIDPTDFYLSGILWPPDEAVGGAEDDAREGENARGDGAADEGAPLFSVFKPSAIGLTCAIEGTSTPFEVLVEAARYVSEPGRVVDGIATVSWRRKALRYRLGVKGDEVRSAWRTSQFELESGEGVEDPTVMVHVRRRVRNGQLVITATLINRYPRPEGERAGQACLYQANLSLTARAEPGTGLIVPRDAGLLSPDEEARSGDLLFSNAHEFAVGHGVGATWSGGKGAKAEKVSTDWLPAHPVPGVTRNGHRSLKPLIEAENSVLAAATLANPKAHPSVVTNLRSFCQAYADWIGDRRKEAASLKVEFQATAKKHLDRCDEALGRMRGGVDLLEKDDAARLAFSLANQVMEDYFRSPVREKPGALRWAPFQLAFMLLTISSIAKGKHPERSVLDLLWFPTGGGKTEAYLGLVLFAIFNRRLSVPGAGGSGHVDVMMRYTLRLLTVQQFQRASSVICRAEVLRRQRTDLGETPISIGLFVGQDATPNRVLSGENNAKDMLQAEAEGRKPSSTPRLLLRCPLCNEELPVSAYQLDAGTPAVNIVCPNGAACPSGGTPLPVHTVDEDVYRVRPSLLIGTVDKFAQLPRREEVGLLFGLPNRLPPEMIIQDELHLISGPLGTVTGLYETVIDLLCLRDDVVPKVIGSTATIGGAQKQVAALFDRGLMQFPPPGLDAADSFFAVRDDEGPDRLYLGISTSGRSPKYTLQSVAASLLQVVQKLRDDGRGDDAVDPYWTLLLYFNSLRELGGAKVLMRDDVRRSVSFLAPRLSSAERPLEVEEPLELTSRIPSSQIPARLAQLNSGLNPDPFADVPPDTVLASNMISVGVDIPRLGLMIVNGQPKTTAEYIQATSRVGRGLPGLIITIYNAARPRDMSHYEHFRQYHQTLYRRVEFMSVTPWSPRARDRALHAVLAAAVRHLDPSMLDKLAASRFRTDLPVVERIVEFVRRRAARAGSATVADEVKAELHDLINGWADRARMYRDNNGKFEYWARANPVNGRPVYPHLMRGSEDPVADPAVWRTPNSMREVEPQSYYVLWPEKGDR